VKNLTSLIIVLCLLIILGCKCQSDLLDLGKKRDAPTPLVTPSPTPSASSTPDNRNRRRDDSTSSSDDSTSSSENSLLRTGTYTGRGKNATYNKSGDFLLRIDSVDSDGNVEAYLEASNGLEGKATMKGTISRDGKLILSGTLDDGKSGAVNGTVRGDTISAGYGIADSKLKTQSGNFTVTRR
jgi:hypothetical protein